MSDNNDKIRNSRRRQQDENAVKKQVKIARQHGAGKAYTDQPHRFAKHHALNCGVPGCMLCANPRHNKISKDRLTIQEKRLFQDADLLNNKHSNGRKNDNESDD